MKKVTQNFKVGAIYRDVPEGHFFPTYLMFIKVDLNIPNTYFKYVGGHDCYMKNDNGLCEFAYPTEMFELSNSEIKDLIAKDIIKLN